MKQYMTTFGERLSYWTYFVGQNVYYNITFIYHIVIIHTAANQTCHFLKHKNSS